jgi:hypothetical protein
VGVVATCCWKPELAGTPASVTVTALGAFTVRVYCAVPVALFASVAVTVKVPVSAAAAVPVMLPVVESENPLGRLPVVTANLYGEAPPVAVRAWVYATPALAAGRVAGAMVMVTATEFTVKERLFEAVCAGELLSVTTAVKVKLPAVVGVPESAPVEELMVRPPLLVEESAYE